VGEASIGNVSPFAKREIRRLEAILFAYMGLQDIEDEWKKFAAHITDHVAKDELEAQLDSQRDNANLPVYVHCDKMWRGRTRRWEIEMLAVHACRCDSCGETHLANSTAECGACKGIVTAQLLSYGNETYAAEDVPADSNCMYHCLLKGAQLPMDIATLRHTLVAWMEANFDVPAIQSQHGAITTFGQMIDFEHGSRESYSHRMRLCVPQQDRPRSNWGTSLELHAFCNLWPFSVRVFTVQEGNTLVSTGVHGRFQPTDGIINLLLHTGHYQILRVACTGPNTKLPMFGAVNGAHPTQRHNAFIGLNRTEEALLSPLLPYIRLVKQKNPSYRPSAYGHSIITPQDDFGEIAKIIPRLPAEVSYIVVTTDNSVAPELVRAGKVKAALEAMRQDQHICTAFQYHGIELSGPRSEAHMAAIEAGSQTGVETVKTAMQSTAPTYLTGMPGQETEHSDDEFTIPPEHETGTFACTEGVASGVTSQENIRRSMHILQGSRQGHPVSDRLPYLWTLSFPTLQFGHCDFNSMEPRQQQFDSKALWFRHLINWSDGRFAGHDLFVGVAQDWIARDTVTKQSGVFMKKMGKADAEMTLEELRTKVADNNLTLMARIQFFAQNLVGSIPYWREIRERLKQFAEWKWFDNATTQQAPALMTAQQVHDAAVETYRAKCGRNLPMGSELAPTSPNSNADELYNIYRANYTDIEGQQLYVAHALATFRASSLVLPLDERARAAFVASQIAFDQALFRRTGHNRNAVAAMRNNMPTEIRDSDIELYLTDLSRHVSGTEEHGALGALRIHEQDSALNFQRAACGEAQPCNPSFFITGSMAELHWPHLWVVMKEYLSIAASQAPQDPTLKFLLNNLQKTVVRERVIQQYGHIASRYFEKRTQMYFQLVLMPCLALDDWFIRYEFAESRKQIHFHSVCWSAFNVGNLVSSGQEHNIVRLARERIRLNAMHPSGINPRQQALHPVYNPVGLPVTRMGPAHPARKLFTCLTKEERHTDDRDCVNVLTTHSCQGNSYCLVPKAGQLRRHPKPLQEQGISGDTRHRCRMGFHEMDWEGKPLTTQREAGVWQTNSKSRKVELIMERNHHRMVQGSKFMRQSWRANCDIQVIVTTDPGAIEDYVLSYSTKEATASPEYKRFFLEFVAAASDATFNVGSLVRKFMLRLSGHREKPAQEILYHASGGNLYEFSKPSAKSISLTYNRRVCTDRQADKAALADNIVDKYRAAMAGTRGLSLYEYALSQAKDKWIYITGAHVPTTWPPTEMLCRTLLLLHCKWVREEDLLKSSKNGEPPYPTFYHKFMNDFLFTADCPGVIRSKLLYKKFCLENPFLMNRKKHYSVEDAGQGEVVPSIGRARHEAAASEVVNSMEDLHFRGPPPGFNWSDPTFEFDGAQHIFDPNIISQMAPADEVYRKLPTFTYEMANTMEHNMEQRGAFTMILEHAKLRRTGHRSDMMQLIIQGGAGTGKTYWVNQVQAAVIALLGPESIRAIAFTGNAANLVYGSTIHSATGIPVLKTKGGQEAELKYLPPLQAPRATRLEAAWEKCKYLIVDERSMLSQRLFAALAIRVSQLQGSLRGQYWGKLWGLIVVGDDAQLAPVNGKQLHEYNFDISSMNSLNLLGFKLYQDIQHCIIFTKNERQAPEEVQFIQLLSNVRTGQVTETDMQYLNGRCAGGKLHLPNGEPHGLFCSLNRDKDIFNRGHLAEIRGPVTAVHSEDSGCAGHLRTVTNTDEFWGLKRTLFLGAGQKVTITQNVSTAAGLTNGACGTILHLHYEIGVEPPALPQFVLIKLEARIPEEWRGTVCPGDETLADVVPLYPLTAPCGTQCCTRKQYPLAMAAASTIHRAQGRTITTKYRINIAAKDEMSWPGIIYTGLSRFRRITDFTLQQPMTPAHFQNVRKKLSTTGRLQEINRLDTMAQRTRQENSIAFQASSFENQIRSL
jgi:hypothetical protein